MVGMQRAMAWSQAIRGQKWNRGVKGLVRGWWRQVSLAVEVWSLTPKEPSK
jgi:hypothetical protein